MPQNNTEKLFIKIVLLLFTFFASTKLFSQDLSPNLVVGIWLNESTKEKIEIYRKGDYFEGKLISGINIISKDGENFKLDTKNSDPSLRNRSLYNLAILTNFQFQEDSWDDGKLYDFKSGKEYDAIIRMKNNILEIRSYIGILLFGRSTYWHRVK
tara:strand:- start:276 stop:740 length:465 start_codon:yes stop_codon:yes gene_type:complete